MQVIVVISSLYFLSDLVFFRFLGPPMFNPTIQTVALLTGTSLAYFYLMLVVEIVASLQLVYGGGKQ